MRKSESIKSLAVALSKFQADVKNPANTEDNPFFKSKYAPLSGILNDVRPLLSKHGLSVIQSPGGDGQNIMMTTLLLHESGEWIESETLVLKADKPTAQGAGSAITYARRYALSAILGIASEDDDDGNHATYPEGRNENKKENKNNSDTVTVQMLQEVLKKNEVSAERVLEKYRKDTGKTASELQFLPQDYKRKVYEGFTKQG